MKLTLKIAACVLLGLLALLAAGVAASWAPDVPVQALKSQWAPPPSRFMPVLGMQVHVRDEGPRDDPLPIVLLHGTSASLHTWDGWAKALRGQRRVIRFDLPAFGLTGPDPREDYSIAAYVRFVTAVMDELQVQRFVLAGNSLGGQVAWETAAALPQRVQRLVLVDAGGYAFKPESVPLGFWIARTPGVRLLMEYTLPRPVVERSVRNVYGNPALVTPELVDRYAAMTLRAGNRHALALRMDQRLAGDEARIKSLHLPTLVLWGGRDHLIPMDSARRFASDIAGAQLVVFDDLGHVPHEEDPARTVAALRRFLQTPVAQ
jgi:pimeloyl-ACP methyl ester carboxylesterase